MFVFSLKMFELGLTTIAILMRKDMNLAEDFIKSLPRDFPKEHLEELNIRQQSLQTAFSSISNVSSEKKKHIMVSIDSELVGVRSFIEGQKFDFEEHLFILNFTQTQSQETETEWQWGFRKDIFIPRAVYPR